MISASARKSSLTILTGAERILGITAVQVMWITRRRADSFCWYSMEERIQIIGLLQKLHRL